MQIIRLNNVGRKFHKFINTDELPSDQSLRNSYCQGDGYFWALRNIYMSIEQGEIVGIIGRNGSGKSTLLNIITGALPVSEGEITVNGQISALLTLGAGFQDEFTGRENIYLNAKLLGLKKDEIERKFASILEFSELGDFIDAPLGSYSAGMRVRLGFSIAIHKDFDVLLTDEIIMVGDIYFQRKCFEKIVEFKKQNKSMIIVTQDMDFIERFCDRAFLLEDGRIFFNGNTKEVADACRMLLNKKKILSESSRLDIVRETKRWATDVMEWGKSEGSKEITIKDVFICNKWGKKLDKIRPGQKITVKVEFSSNNEIDNFHFGVAIFREDGVYCYGPNTQFDGLAIEKMRRGSGFFEIEYKELLLMPGIYFLSVAIWDKNETFAYDYHKCKHKIEVIGNVFFGQLLYLPNRWASSNLLIPLIASNKRCFPNLDYLVDKWSNETNDSVITFKSVKFLNNYGIEDSVFTTGKDFKVKVDFLVNKSLEPCLILWIGIYRSDTIYCHGSIKKVIHDGINSEVLIYPKLRLLPGGYKVSVAIWDYHAQKFLSYSHGVYSFHIISERKDHGTVYLEHCWNWKIPKGGTSDAD